MVEQLAVLMLSAHLLFVVIYCWHNLARFHRRWDP